MSGLSRTPGKRVWANTHRGFESRPLRQGSSKHGPHGPFFFCAAASPPPSPSGFHSPHAFQVATVFAGQAALLAIAQDLARELEEFGFFFLEVVVHFV